MKQHIDFNTNIYSIYKMIYLSEHKLASPTITLSQYLMCNGLRSHAINIRNYIVTNRYNDTIDKSIESQISEIST